MQLASEETLMVPSDALQVAGFVVNPADPGQKFVKGNLVPITS